MVDLIPSSCVLACAPSNTAVDEGDESFSKGVGPCLQVFARPGKEGFGIVSIAPFWPKLSDSSPVSGRAELDEPLISEGRRKLLQLEVG